VVEVIPTCLTFQYLLPGSIVMSIFMMVMIAAAYFTTTRPGLHEGIW